jgi:phage terminase large subunit
MARLERDNPLVFYEPYESRLIRGRYPQDLFHSSLAKIRLLVGGNRSGKSESGFVEDIWCAMGCHPYIKMPVPNVGWIVSLSFKKQVEVTEQKLKKWLPKGIVKNWDNKVGCISLTNGSQIWLKSCEQDLETFGGVSIHWAHCDEEPPGIKGKKIYDELLMRTAEYRGKLWFTLTPVGGMSWTYEELIEKAPYDKDIYYIEVDSRENPYVPLDELESIARKLSQDELEMRLKGKYIQFAGLVYKEFNKDVHVIPPFKIPSHYPKFRAIDHGINRDHPTVCLWAAVGPNGELYVYDEYYQSDKTIRENCESIRAITAGDRIIWTVIDPATEARDPQTGKTNRNEYRDNGIPTRAERTDKNAGINKVQQMLLNDTVTGRPQLYVFNTCYNIIREFSRYRWHQYRGASDIRSNDVVKIDDDGLDALRYLIMSKPRYEIEQDYADESKVENEPWY